MASGYAHGKHYVFCETGHWGLPTSTWVLCCESCGEPRRHRAAQLLQGPPQGMPLGTTIAPTMGLIESPTAFSAPSHFLRPHVSLSPQPSFQGSSTFAPLCCHWFLTGQLSPPKVVSINGQMSKSFSGVQRLVPPSSPWMGLFLSLWFESEFSTPYLDSIRPFPLSNNSRLFPSTGGILPCHSDELLLAGAGQHPAPPLCGRTAVPVPTAADAWSRASGLLATHLF